MLDYLPFAVAAEVGRAKFARLKLAVLGNRAGQAAFIERYRARTPTLRIRREGAGLLRVSGRRCCK